MMIKRLFCASLLLCFAAFFCGCEEDAVPTTSSAYEEVITDDSVTVFESDLGYVMEYDPQVFYVLTDDSGDVYGLRNESADSDVISTINVERVRGYTVKEYTDDITKAVESGVWSVTEAEFGAERVKSTTVLYREKAESGTLLHTVVLVKDNTDIIVLETVTHSGVSEETEDIILDTLTTFRLN